MNETFHDTSGIHYFKPGISWKLMKKKVEHIMEMYAEGCSAG